MVLVVIVAVILLYSLLITQQILLGVLASALVTIAFKVGAGLIETG